MAEKKNFFILGIDLPPHRWYNLIRTTDTVVKKGERKMAMTNLEKASRAYDKLMRSIGVETIAERIKEDMMDANYTIDDLVANAQYYLDINIAEDSNYLDYLENYGSDEEWKDYHSENRRLRYFIKKWEGVK